MLHLPVMMRFIHIAALAAVLAAAGCASRKASVKSETPAGQQPAALSGERKPNWAPKYHLPYRPAKMKPLVWVSIVKAPFM